MDTDLTTLSEAGIDTKSGMGYTGGKDKYISALQRYYKNYEKNKSKVLEYFNAKDYENYMITVHALKSNSKMIGADDLGKGFEELEMAARDGNIEIIESKNAVVIEEYTKTVDLLKPFGEMEDVRAAGEISGDEARDIAEKLLEALDDFDDELSKQFVVKLSGYPFRLTQKDLLKKAEENIDDFLYDEAATLIRQVYIAIE
ncbi:MAG: hypothetical protein K5639_04290 [Eubacterium sp.]|nr:hypothetical protein [Eubacterium sp.]